MTTKKAGPFFVIDFSTTAERLAYVWSGDEVGRTKARDYESGAFLDVIASGSGAGCFSTTDDPVGFVSAAAGTTNALTAKATVVDGDVFAIEDSAATYARKKTLFSTVVTYILSVSRTFLGAIRQTPTQFAFSTTPSLAVSGNNAFQMTDIVTADFALTLTGGQDGDCGTISFKQAAAGGKKITGITVAGRTVVMRNDLASINTGDMLVANAKVVLDYQFLTAVDAVVIIGIRSGIAAAFT